MARSGRTKPSRNIRIVAAGLLSIAAFSIVRALPSSVIPRNADTIVRAATIMQTAIQAISRARAGSGGMDPSLDPNRTGLIGPESSPLVTTPGDLAAKRSTTNPNMAGYLVHLLDQAGVQPGDHIAVGSSGSFPALLVASLSAAKAMDVHAVTILSLGASSYGAGDPGFNLLDIYRVLQQEGICADPPVAASLGGDKDTGADFNPEIRTLLIGRIESSGIYLLNEPDLGKNVSQRMRMYQNAAAAKIAAFINCGGSFANLGTSSLVLELKPGLNRGIDLPPAFQRGMLYEMAAHRVPVIHLLFVKGLVAQAGLPWDPIPLPQPDLVHPPGSAHALAFWLVAGIYFALLLLLFLL